MEDVDVVESLEAVDDLDEHLPDLALLKGGVVLLVVADLLVEVAVVSVLHDDAG